MLANTVWLQVKPETRRQIAKTFGLHRSGGTIVEGKTVMSDGYRPQDLAVLSLAVMQEHLKTDITDFYKLFQEIVFRIENPDETRVKLEVVFDQLQNDVIPEVQPEATPEATSETRESKSCCGSRGFRHKKNCPLKQ